MILNQYFRKYLLLNKTFHLLCWIATLVLVSGCSNIKPWVKAYQRDKLADPITSPAPHPVDTTYMIHVFQSREGARGAEGLAGGGCGCN